MRHTIHALIYRNIPYKIIAVLLGIAFWLIGSSISTVHLQVHVPVCFYHQKNEFTIQAPETIMVHLAASRYALSMIDMHALAVHIDCSQLQPGPCSIAVSHKTLLLPEEIRIVEHASCTIMVGQSATQIVHP